MHVQACFPAFTPLLLSNPIYQLSHRECFYLIVSLPFIHKWMSLDLYRPLLAAFSDLWHSKINFIQYISMDVCTGNVTDVCKTGQELRMSLSFSCNDEVTINCMKMGLE